MIITVFGALEGLRQFSSDTVRAAVIEADRAEEIATRNRASAMMVAYMRQLHATAPPHLRCSGCLRRFDGAVSAYVWTHLLPVDEQEVHLLCTKCGHGDEAVQGVVQFLTRALQADAGIGQREG